MLVIKSASCYLYIYTVHDNFVMGREWERELERGERREGREGVEGERGGILVIYHPITLINYSFYKIP